MEKFIIPLDGWAAGERKFSFHAGLEFFQTFENKEILDASLDVEVLATKASGHVVEADLHIDGMLTVPCDRCLEAVSLPVTADYSLSPSEDFVFTEDGEGLDLSQAVYDTSCLAIPLKKVHPEGECNPATVRFLSLDERPNEEAGNENSPFAALKGLFDSK